MINWSSVYERIDAEEYDQIKEYLQPFAKDQYSWKLYFTLGLVESKRGYPSRALYYWSFHKGEKLTKEQHTLMAETRKLLDWEKKVLEYYENACYLIRKNRVGEASSLVEYIVVHAEGRNVPTQVYAVLFLLYLKQCDWQKAKNFYEKMPSYIKNHRVIRNAASLLEMEYEDVEDKKERAKLKWGIGAAVSFLLISLIGYVGTNWIADKNELHASKVQIEQLREEKELVKQQLAKIEQENKKIEAKEKSVKDKKDTFHNTTASKGKSEETLYQLYTNARKDYLKGNFQSAIQKSKQVIEDPKTYYFTDDAHYFYLESFYKQEKYDELLEICREFLKRNDQNYKESSYRKEVELRLAESLLEKGNVKDGSEILEKLSTNNKEEWTTKKAKHLLRLMKTR